jgi:hypothetical protein
VLRAFSAFVPLALALPVARLDGARRCQVNSGKIESKSKSIGGDYFLPLTKCPLVTWKLTWKIK